MIDRLLVSLTFWAVLFGAAVVVVIALLIVALVRNLDPDDDEP